VPRARVPLASAGTIAPALRAHYALAADGAALAYAPTVRVCAGPDPLARAALCMWKGKTRFNVMLHTDEAASACRAG